MTLTFFLKKKPILFQTPKILTRSVSKILENSKKINRSETHENTLFPLRNSTYTPKKQNFSDPVRGKRKNEKKKKNKFFFL